MKRLKVITIVLLVLTFALRYSNNHQQDVLNNYQQAAINLENPDMKVDDYYEWLKSAADQSDVILLNSRLENDQINWYCIGTKCDLEADQYYSTTNDSQAKLVLPFKVTRPTKIYSFASLDNIPVNHNSFTILALDDQGISDFQERLESDGATVTTASGSERLLKEQVSTILILGLLCMYLITLIATAKKYVLDKYNGKYLYEALISSAITNGLIVLIASVLGFILIFFKLDNTSLFIHQLNSLLFMLVGLYLLITACEWVICCIVRRIYSYKDIANTLSKYNLVLLFFASLLPAIVANVYATKAEVNIVNLIADARAIPDQQLSDYYSYALTFSGDGAAGLDYLQEYIDPQHVLFYKATESEYNGIVTCFQSCSTNYPVINQNYLEFTNNDVEVDSSQINLVTNEQIADVPASVNQVIEPDDTYSYINQDSGLVETYTGPVYVINSNVIDDIDPTIVSVTLQINNYFLKLADEVDLAAVNSLRTSLNLDQNTSELYPVSAIANDFASEQKQMLQSNLDMIGLSITLVILNLIMYISYRFEILNQRFSLQYVHGQSLTLAIIREWMVVMIPNLLATVIIHNPYAIVFFLGISVFGGCLVSYKWWKLTSDISKLMKE